MDHGPHMSIVTLSLKRPPLSKNMDAVLVIRELFQPSNSVAGWSLAGSEGKPRPGTCIIFLSKNELLPLLKGMCPKWSACPQWLAGLLEGWCHIRSQYLSILLTDLIDFRAATRQSMWTRGFVVQLMLCLWLCRQKFYGWIAWTII